LIRRDNHGAAELVARAKLPSLLAQVALGYFHAALDQRRAPLLRGFAAVQDHAKFTHPARP
jgi:hypothetical protein